MKSDPFVRRYTYTQFNEEADYPMPVQMLCEEQDTSPIQETDTCIGDAIGLAMACIALLTCGFMAGKFFS